MNKYEIRTNIKKEAILRASLELFRQNGFINTNIKEIAAKAKVSQVSIYNYFGSKTLLVKEAICMIMKDILVNAKEIIKEPIPFIDRVKKALSICSEETSKSINDFFSVAALEDPQMVEAIISAMKEQQRKVYQIFIETGKTEGSIHANIPTETILDFICAVDALGSSPNYSHHGFRDDIIKLLFHGILIDKSEV